jgi:hypothetical protein
MEKGEQEMQKFEKQKRAYEQEITHVPYIPSPANHMYLILLQARIPDLILEDKRLLRSYVSCHCIQIAEAQNATLPPRP